ncbi:MAG: hypothetical protein ACOZJX_17480 [Pseudomonadota bacterium]
MNLHSWAATLSLAMPALVMAAPVYHVTDVAPYVIEPVSVSINAAGQVSGSGVHEGQQRAFRFDDGVLIWLARIGSSDASSAISRRGEVIGSCIAAKPNKPSYSGCTWRRDGSQARVHAIGKSVTWLNDINDGGDLVGTYADGADAMTAFRRNADGTVIDLGTLGGTHAWAKAINNNRQVVGDALKANGASFAFIHDDAGGMRDLGSLNGGGSRAYGINEAGEAVGDATTPEGATRAVLFRSGEVIDLGTLSKDGEYSTARAINRRTQVVGWSDAAADPLARAMIWSGGRMRALDNLLDPATGAGWTLHKATDINDDGQIVGIGRHHGQWRIFLLTPMP